MTRIFLLTLFSLVIVLSCNAQSDSRRVLSRPEHGQPIYTVVFADSASDSELEVMKLMVRYLFRDVKPDAPAENRSYCVATPESLFVDHDYLQKISPNIKAAHEHCAPEDGWPFSLQAPVRAGKDELKIVVGSGGPMMLTISTYSFRRSNGYWRLYSSQVTGYS